MWFLFALCTILFWGGSDLFSKMATDPKDKFSHWRMIIVVGIVMGLHGFYTLFTEGAGYSISSLFTYLPVSLLYIGAMVLGYAGLRYIELSVSSPICNSSGAVAALLCVVFLGDTVDLIPAIAIGVICVGIFALSVIEKRQADKEAGEEAIKAERKYRFSAIAIILPVLYCIIDGMGTFADAFYLDVKMSELEANMSYEFTFLIIAIVAWIYLVLVRKQKFSLFGEKTRIAGAICETAGQFTYVFALAGNAVVAAPMMSSYCICSAILSHIFLKEKLSKAQYMALIPVILAIIVLGIYDI